MRLRHGLVGNLKCFEDESAHGVVEAGSRVEHLFSQRCKHLPHLAEAASLQLRSDGDDGLNRILVEDALGDEVRAREEVRLGQIHQRLDQDLGHNWHLERLGVKLVELEHGKVGFEVVRLRCALRVDVRLELRQDGRIEALRGPRGVEPISGRRHFRVSHVTPTLHSDSPMNAK